MSDTINQNLMRIGDAAATLGQEANASQRLSEALEQAAHHPGKRAGSTANLMETEAKNPHRCGLFFNMVVCYWLDQ